MGLHPTPHTVDRKEPQYIRHSKIRNEVTVIPFERIRQLDAVTSGRQARNVCDAAHPEEGTSKQALAAPLRPIKSAEAFLP